MINEKWKSKNIGMRIKLKKLLVRHIENTFTGYNTIAE